MGQKTIQPTRLSGRVKVPPSKSMAHRAIICAALAEGRSTVGKHRVFRRYFGDDRGHAALGRTH